MASCPVGQVSDGGLHWAAMALNWSMPSAPPFISRATLHWPVLGSSSALGVGHDLAGRLGRTELVDGDDLAVVVELGQHHRGLGEVLLARRELDSRCRLAGHGRRGGVAAGVVVVVVRRAVVVVVPPSWNGVAARPGPPPAPWSSSSAAVVVVVSPAAVVVVDPSASVVVVASRTSGGIVLEQHRTEPELGGGADQVEGALLLVDAGELHDDRVALPGDLRLGDAEGVDAVADDLDRLVEGVVGGGLGGLEHHRHAALEVEAELGRGVRDEAGAEGDGRGRGR